jgi:hypothetical protein
MGARVQPKLAKPTTQKQSKDRERVPKYSVIFISPSQMMLAQMMSAFRISQSTACCPILDSAMISVP